ncbi:hypothetical protein DBR12_20320, partial [Acidovorax sp. HMWF029]
MTSLHCPIGVGPHRNARILWIHVYAHRVLERLTKRCEMANADDAASQRKQRDMNVDPAFEA